MEQISLFEETQEPNKKIGYVFIVILVVCVLVATVNFLVIKNPFLFIPLLPMVIVSIVFCLLVTKMGVTLQICSDGIYFQQKTFKNSEKFFSFPEIDEIVIGQLDIPGRSFRYGGFAVKSGRQYSMYLFGGYDAIHIKLKSGKTYIFSTQRMQELIAAANKLDRNKVKTVIQ